MKLCEINCAEKSNASRAFQLFCSLPPTQTHPQTHHNHKLTMAFLEFYKFACKESFRMPKDDWREVTFSTLNGMCLHIPVEKRAKLWEHIAKWGRDERSDITISENRSPGCARVFFDIDGGWDVPVTPEMLLHVGRIASALLKRIAPEEDCTCLVLGPSKSTKTRDGKCKLSAHIVFPFLRAPADVQSALAKAMNDALRRDGMFARASLAGEIVADDTKAMRLPFTIKAKRCEHCTRRKGGCDECSGGYVYDRRWFSIVGVIGKDGEYDEDLTYEMNDPITLLEHASIRTDGQEPSPHLSWARVTSETGHAPAADVKACPKTLESISELQLGSTLAKGTAVKELPLFCAEAVVLRDFMQRECGPWYRELGISRIILSTKMNRSTGIYVLYVEGPGARFCQNYGKSHNGRQIYFCASADKGMWQRCTCQCETMAGRNNGYCKNFSSEPKLFGPHEKSVLFGANHVWPVPLEMGRQQQQQEAGAAADGSSRGEEGGAQGGAQAHPMMPPPAKRDDPIEDKMYFNKITTNVIVNRLVAKKNGFLGVLDIDARAHKRSRVVAKD